MPRTQIKKTDERAPIDLVCVIDKSGSMRGEKIELVKSTLIFMIEQLCKKDRLSLISFDSDVTLEFDLEEMNDEGKEKATNIINKLKPGSCTNLSGGLFKSFDIIKKRKECAEVCSVLLFTDGLANEGVKNIDEIKKIMSKSIESMEKRTSVYTFGFGKDHDGNMLKSNIR